MLLNENEKIEYKIRNLTFFIKILNNIVNTCIIINICLIIYNIDINNKELIYNIIEFFIIYPMINIALKHYYYFMIILFFIYKIFFNVYNFMYVFDDISYVKVIILSLNNYIIYFLFKLIYYLYICSGENIENIINEPIIKQKFLYCY